MEHPLDTMYCNDNDEINKHVILSDFWGLIVLAFISQGHNLYKLQYIYHLKKLKLCLFNNDFKVRPSRVTYLGYI